MDKLPEILSEKQKKRKFTTCCTLSPLAPERELLTAQSFAVTGN